MCPQPAGVEARRVLARTLGLPDRAAPSVRERHTIAAMASRRAQPPFRLCLLQGGRRARSRRRPATLLAAVVIVGVAAGAVLAARLASPLIAGVDALVLVGAAWAVARRSM